MNKHCAIALALSTTVLATVSASAQLTQLAGLPDPTRPPAGLQAAGAASAPTETQALVLQSVLLGPGRAPAAVISGQLVPLGGMVGDLRLAHVSDHAVQLKGPQGLTSLTLVPVGAKQSRPQRNQPSGMEPTK